MLDFLIPSSRSIKKEVIEIYPKFIVKKSKDLMIRGNDFYAIWNEHSKMWSTDQDIVSELVDEELNKYKQDKYSSYSGRVVVKNMWDSESGSIDMFHKYCQKQMRDNYHALDEKIIFQNTEIKKEDYATKRLPYSLSDGDISAYTSLMNVLYSPEEKMKIEWAIGSIVNGDSINIQKFIVLYGSAGTGKSTVLNVIQQLFDGYYSVFDAKALGSSNDAFALEAFKSNPLVAIQHDGDLSRIEDNGRINSLISHEKMTVNEKFKAQYSTRFNSFLFLGTNKPVKITDAKSGIIRRLIDVEPTGNKIPFSEYKTLMSQISFELGGIAFHCNQVYESNKTLYENYIPTSMIGATNDFYNFIEDNVEVFKENDPMTLKDAWELYKTYCDDAKVLYPYSKRPFKIELENYYKNFDAHTNEGSNIYSDFRVDKIVKIDSKIEKKIEDSWLNFNNHISILDTVLASCLAQLATPLGSPKMQWNVCKTKLSDIDTSELHYVNIPETLNMIVIDFDLKDKNGNKSFAKNYEEAKKWPMTYAELSKSGEGIHLHYYYDGDILLLSNIYDKDIEIKKFNGNSALRRKLTKCNNLPIAKINSGLKLKESAIKGDTMINKQVVKSEISLRNSIIKNLNKEIHADTTSSVSFISKILDDAYNSKLSYDVTDMRPAITAFAAKSTHQSGKCLALVKDMKFKSEDISDAKILSMTDEEIEKKILFYDVEVFPNLFVVCFKVHGSPMEKSSVVKMINPKSSEIDKLVENPLVGFNCRRYDNHILYAKMIGYNNEELYRLSKRIIDNSSNCFFGDAYNISYTDIYDYSSKKQSLKKFEIELGINHQENHFDWNKPVPKEYWDEIADYCANDVLATEATFEYTKEDFTVRKIAVNAVNALCSGPKSTVNDTTNTLSKKLVFRGDTDTDKELVYTDLSTGKSTDGTYSKYNCFPGYKFEQGVSTYKGIKVGEGGYVEATEGIYTFTGLLDVESLHPHTIQALNLFGKYTKNYVELMDTRLAIKHKEFDKAKTMLNGALSQYIHDNMTKEEASKLSKALKIMINAVYGLTAAKFKNQFKDVRNVDNIVAKRGALFMIQLKEEIEKKGFQVVHVKTDSFKIPNITEELIKFVNDYAEPYGYKFDHEATFEKICLVNHAVYVCKVLEGEENGAGPGEWSATGTQFKTPYVFKTLFSHESIKFEDMTETKSVTNPYSMQLLFNEDETKSERYEYIGKVGSFCPIKAGYGGALLLKSKDDDKFSAVTGTKGYRWMESEMVKYLYDMSIIDDSYYNKMVDDAIDQISKYGSYGWFVSNDPVSELDVHNNNLHF